MRWYCLQHVPFEGPAYLGDWTRRQGHELVPIDVWTGGPWPNLRAGDGVFVLGGPMNVYEEDRYPWLKAEKRFLADAIAAGGPVLGICLGAQLLSLVLGGSVTRNRWPEIGWFPVEITAAGREAPVFRGFPPRFIAFHWHGDRFSTPPGAVHAGQSEACDQQAFVFGDRVVGLQFHLESTSESIRSLIENCGDEITRGPYLQEAAAMHEGVHYLATCHALLEQLLDRMTE